MIRLLSQRLLQALLVGVLVAALGFLLMRMLPGDMAFRVAAGRYGYDVVGGAAADLVRAELGLDRPLWLQFLAWLGGLARFDLGISLISGNPVIDEIAHQLGATLRLSAAALLVALLIGPPLGLLAGLRPGGVLDRATMVTAAVLRALPSYLIGLGLMLVFAARLGWLPAADPDSLAGLVLPAIALGLGLAAISARVARDAAVAAHSAPHFSFSRLKGLSEAQSVQRHLLRNAAVPVVSYLGVQLVLLVEGVVVIEALFGWPGIGHALVHAVLARDVPMVQGTALAMGLLFVLLNALNDMACLALDPRRRNVA
jgi:peptide/nickel transport system permease protein